MSQFQLAWFCGLFYVEDTYTIVDHSVDDDYIRPSVQRKGDLDFYLMQLSENETVEL